MAPVHKSRLPSSSCLQKAAVHAEQPKQKTEIKRAAKMETKVDRRVPQQHVMKHSSPLPPQPASRVLMRCAESGRTWPWSRMMLADSFGGLGGWFMRFTGHHETWCLRVGKGLCKNLSDCNLSPRHFAVDLSLHSDLWGGYQTWSGCWGNLLGSVWGPVGCAWWI